MPRILEMFQFKPNRLIPNIMLKMSLKSCSFVTQDLVIAFANSLYEYSPFLGVCKRCNRIVCPIGILYKTDFKQYLVLAWSHQFGDNLAGRQHEASESRSVGSVRP